MLKHHDGDYGVELTWREEVNSNAYYFVSVYIPHASVSSVASGGANGAKFEIRHTRVGRDAMNGENEL